MKFDVSVMVLHAATDKSHCYLIQSFSEFLRFSAQIAGVIVANALPWKVVQYVCLGVQGFSAITMAIHFLTLKDAVGWRRLTPVTEESISIEDFSEFSIFCSATGSRIDISPKDFGTRVKSFDFVDVEHSKSQT